MKPEDENKKQADSIRTPGSRGNDATLMSDTMLTERPGAAEGSGGARAPEILEVAQGKLNDRQVIKERFILEELLGFGGMGTVYKARDLRKVEASDRDPWVAIKLLNEDFKQRPNALIALQREARKAQTLAHPNIVKVFDFDRDGDVVYLTMEMLRGQDLNHFLQEFPDGIGLTKGIRLGQQMADALHHAHQKGIVHADFSPKNVFLTEDGDARVLDFGIAQAIARAGAQAASGETTLFDPSTMGGLTPGYASFEQLTGKEPQPADDVFSLACTLYQLLTGRHPYGEGTAVDAVAQHLRPERIEGLTRPQWRALNKALSLLREQRHADAGEFLDDFRSGKSPARKPWIAAAAVILTVAAVSLYQAYTAYREDQERQAKLRAQRSALEATEEQLLREQALKTEEAARERDRIAGEYLGLAAVLIAENKFDEARQYVDRVEAIAPEYDGFEELKSWLALRQAAHRERLANEAQTRADIDRLMEQSQDHIAAGNLLRPEGANAYRSYLQIVELEPGHVGARAILQRLVQMHLDQLDDALQSGELDQAAVLLDDLDTITPGNEQLVQLRAQLKRAVAQRRERDSRTETLLGQAARLKGADTAARRRDIYQDVLQIDPFNHQAQAGLESAMKELEADRARARQQAREDAEALLRHAAELLTESPARAEAYRQAYQYLLEAQSRFPESRETRAMMDELPRRYIETIEELMAAGQYGEAGDFLQAAIAIAPQNSRLVQLREELDAADSRKDDLVLPSSF